MCKFLFIIMLVSTVSCQTLENGWKGIKPLRTDKTTVEKILGEPEIDENGYHGYRVGSVFVQVNYSSAPCEVDRYQRGKYSVAENTVLDYSVNFLSNELKLSDLTIDRKRYHKETDDHIEGLSHFYNEDDDILITVESQNNIEYVGRIIFRARKAEIKKFLCRGK